MILYKYRGISEYTNKIFTEKAVWLSNAEGLNDPFECSIEKIAKCWIDKHGSEGNHAQLSGFIFSALESIQTEEYFFGMPPVLTKALIETLKLEQSFQHRYKTYREFIKHRTGHYPSDPYADLKNFDQQLNEVGIFSLSASADNPLLWAHYADEFRGVAIGFSVEEGMKLADDDHCIAVRYTDSLPSFNGSGYRKILTLSRDENDLPYAQSKVSFADPTFKATVSTKSECWNYEKEWRYIEESAGSYPWPGPIKELVFGLRCKNEDRLKYIDLVENYVPNGVDFFEIQQIPNSNQIRKIAFNPSLINSNVERD